MSMKWNKYIINRKESEPVDNTFGFKREIAFDNRFHAIYFVDSLTGSLLISNKFSDKSSLTETDEDLISSFLNAINMFIKEIQTNKNDEIQEINFKDTRILYEKKGRILCIGITKKTNLRIEREILANVLKDFYYRFENEINHFKGFIAPAILNYKNNLKNLNLNSLNKYNNMDL